MANRETVKAFRVEGFAEAIAHGPGAFWFEEATEGAKAAYPKATHCFFFIVPGESSPRVIYCSNRGEQDNGVWLWDGNVESPTLDPSILAYARTSMGVNVEHWHGWLRSGTFESCAG